MMINSSFVPLGIKLGRYKYVLKARNDILLFAFLPKATNAVRWQVFWLVPLLTTFPSHPGQTERNSGSRKIKRLWNSQHRGMLRIFYPNSREEHRIPF